jgi:uncharacterized protein
MDELQTFLAKHKFPGRVIFAKIWGSRSHNTQKPDSDIDYSGVYVANTKDMLGLFQPPDVVNADNEDGKVDKNTLPDFQFYEVYRFCELLLKGNPAIIEQLWTEKLYHTSVEWQRLRKIRNKFLFANVVHQYLGYMNGQLRRLIAHSGQKGLHTHGGAYNEKFCYHILRLAEDAKRIAKGLEPIVWKEGPERDFLMKVRNGEFSWEDCKSYIDEAIASVEAEKPFNLPEEGDKQALSDWLVQVRLENM